MPRSLPRSVPFALRIKEGRLHDPRTRAATMMLHRDFHLDMGIRLFVRGLHVPERDVLLEQRRPASARRVAHLLPALVDRYTRPPGDGWQARRQMDLRIQSLERHPVDIQPDQGPRTRARAFGGECALSDKWSLIPGYRPPEVQLERR